jgi:hypothetical protein
MGLGTVKGPAVFLAHFAGDDPPVNSCRHADRQAA